MTGMKGIYVGAVLPTNDGPVLVLAVKDFYNVHVMFLDPIWETRTRASHLRSGKIRNRMKRNVYGVGYIGDGPFLTETEIYTAWRSMLRRVYEPHCEMDARNYFGASVVENWFNFQIFAAWYDDQLSQYNHFQSESWSWQVDKDLLYPGNKIYSPTTCCLIPGPINSLFLHGRHTGENLPIGVRTFGKNYRAMCRSTNGKVSVSKVCKTIPEAQMKYWEMKFQAVRLAVDEYGQFIPSNLRDRFANFGWSEAIAYYGYETVFGLSKDAA